MRISCPAIMTGRGPKWMANLAICLDFGRWPAVIFIPAIGHYTMTANNHAYSSGQDYSNKAFQSPFLLSYWQ